MVQTVVQNFLFLAKARCSAIPYVGRVSVLYSSPLPVTS